MLPTVSPLTEPSVDLVARVGARVAAVRVPVNPNRPPSRSPGSRTRRPRRISPHAPCFARVSGSSPPAPAAGARDADRAVPEARSAIAIEILLDQGCGLATMPCGSSVIILRSTMTPDTLRVRKIVSRSWSHHHDRQRELAAAPQQLVELRGADPVGPRSARRTAAADRRQRPRQRRALDHAAGGCDGCLRRLVRQADQPHLQHRQRIRTSPVEPQVLGIGSCMFCSTVSAR